MFYVTFIVTSNSDSYWNVGKSFYFWNELQNYFSIEIEVSSNKIQLFMSFNYQKRYIKVIKIQFIPTR